MWQDAGVEKLKEIAEKQKIIPREMQSKDVFRNCTLLTQTLIKPENR